VSDEDRPKHPSGRPIRDAVEKKLSIIRNPGVGPLVERLRQPLACDLIGFHRTIPHEDDEWLFDK
jgi:hypothetical protein